MGMWATAFYPIVKMYVRRGTMSCILHMSDFHLGKNMKIEKDRLDELAMWIENSDLSIKYLIFTGDIIDAQVLQAECVRKLKKEYSEKFKELKPNDSPNIVVDSIRAAGDDCIEFFDNLIRETTLSRMKQAGEIFRSFIDRIGVDRRNVVLCCGNHDRIRFAGEPDFACKGTRCLEENIMDKQFEADAFDEYTDFSLTDVSAEDTLISAKFTYQGSPLTLYVSDPSDNYLRRIMVCIEDRIADDLKIPAHYIRYNNQDKQSVLCLLDKEQHVLSACSLSELIDLYLGQTQSLLSLSPWQKKAEYLKEFEFYWNAACKRIGNTDNQAEVYLPASETAALLSCWYTKNNGIGKYVFFPEGVTFNSSNIPQGTQSTAVYIPIEFPSGIIPPRGNAPWNAHDLLDIICNQTKDRISAKSYDFLKNLQIDNYQKPLVFSFSQPESVTITITGILSFNTCC